MNPIKNNGKYFIRDAEIFDSQNDKFKHADIAKNIINIIENNMAPFNIAIVGKWGLGKSSLINIVKQHLSTQKNEYIIEDINAWKYEKEALKRVLLRKTLSHLDYEDKNVLTEFLDGLTSHKGNVQEVDKTFVKRFKSEWCPLILNAIVIYVIGVIFSIIGQYIISNVNVSTFDFKNWVSFVLNSFAGNFYIPLLVVLFEKFINTSSGKHNFKITPPITSVDEYERELEKRLSRAKYQNKKIIVIVDDLDRLTPNKIVEALDAIKAFVGYTNFIFIVPFDDTILKDAIKREKTCFVYNEHLTIESDLFLDKLFQYRISLPSVIQSDISQYVIEATQKDAEDLIKLCGANDFNLICKEILIHKKVTTPRQAKKIINTFANNLLLGYRRENNGVVDGAFTSRAGKRFLAKMSVLQADFPSFYSNLFIDNNIIDDFLALTDIEEITEINNELLLPYFCKKANENDFVYKLNKTGESLSMFLHRTAAVTTNNIARFLYLNDDRLSELFGNEFSSNIRDGLLSGDYNLVREKIENNLNKDITNLLYEILSNSEPNEFEFCCIGIINVSDINNIRNDAKLISLVNDRLKSLFLTNRTLDAKNLNLSNAIDIFKQYKDYNGVDSLILNHFKNEASDIFTNLTVFFEKENDLSEDVQSYVKDLITNKCSTERTKLTFDSLFKIDSLDLNCYFEKYFSDLNIFENIYNELISKENYDKENTTVLAFVQLFEKHIQHDNADRVLNIVESNLENSEFVELLLQNLVNYADKFKEANIINKVSIKLIEVSNDNIKNNINLWLSKAKWKIISDQNDNVDEYIKENIDSQYIDKIILNIVNNNQVSLIPKTINIIHDSIFNNNIQISTLYEMQKQYEETQITNLIEKLKPAFSNSNSDNDMLKYATKILKTISTDSKNKKGITLLADYIYSQNNTYPTKMIDKLQSVVEFKQGISDITIEQFLSWASSNINSYFTAGITILNVFQEDIPDTEYNKFSDKIMQSANEDTVELSLKLLRKFRKAFTKAPQLFKTYKNFLISHLNNNYCRKSIIKDISDNYLKIEDVNELVCEIAKYEDIINESIALVIKITEGYSDDQLETVIQNVLDAANIKFIRNVDRILSGWLKSKYSIIIKKSLENLDNSISIVYAMNLAKISTPMSEIDLSLKTNLFSVLLANCDDTIIPNILLECKTLGRLSKNTDKRKLGEALYNTFRQTDKMDLKTQIFSLVKSTGTITAFEIDEEKKKREFSNKEKEILKAK